MYMYTFDTSLLSWLLVKDFILCYLRFLLPYYFREIKIFVTQKLGTRPLEKQVIDFALTACKY